MTASSTQGHDAAERSFELTPAAEGLVLRLTEGATFDATLVLAEVVEADAEAGRPRPSRRMGRMLRGRRRQGVRVAPHRRPPGPECGQLSSGVAGGRADGGAAPRAPAALSGLDGGVPGA